MARPIGAATDVDLCSPATTLLPAGWAWASLGRAWLPAARSAAHSNYCETLNLNENLRDGNSILLPAKLGISRRSKRAEPVSVGALIVPVAAIVTAPATH